MIKCLKCMLAESHDVICVSCTIHLKVLSVLMGMPLSQKVSLVRCTCRPMLMYCIELDPGLVPLCSIAAYPCSFSLHSPPLGPFLNILLKLLEPLPQPHLLQCVAKMAAHYQLANTDDPLDAGKTSIFQELLAVASLLLRWHTLDWGVEVSTLQSLYSAVERALTALIPSVSVLHTSAAPVFQLMSMYNQE